MSSQVGFKISGVVESNKEAAIDFISSILLLHREITRSSIEELLKDSRYIYYGSLANVDTVQPFLITPVNLTGVYYKNISDQKLEVPTLVLLGVPAYTRLNKGQYIQPGSSEVREILDKEFVSRKLLAKIDAGGFLYLLQENGFLLLLETTGKIIIEE